MLRRPKTAILAFAILTIVGLTALARTGIPQPPDAEAAVRVVRVVDGDTIRVSLNGRDVTVRYIGIDTPESVDPRRPVQPFGREASERNKQLVEGRTVRLEKDVSETDRFGRLLRYVYVGTEMANAVLVREGYAHAVSFPPDVKHQDMFRQLEREARGARRGLWAAEP